MDGTRFAYATIELGPWSRSDRSKAEGDPPHFLGTDPQHPNELGVIWADDDHLEAIAVEDYDGCRAAVTK